MEGKQLAQIGLIVVAIGAAGFFVWRNAQSFSNENPDITTKKILYLCGNDKCQESFEVSVGESREYTARTGESIMPCPKCGKTLSAPAFRCPSCSKVVPAGGHGTPPKTCPFCKAKLPRDLE